MKVIFEKPPHLLVGWVASNHATQFILLGNPRLLLLPSKYGRTPTNASLSHCGDVVND
jgi:hypothetical protein